MDGEYLGNNKINLGYGKSLATNCLWVAGVAGKRISSDGDFTTRIMNVSAKMNSNVFCCL